MLDRAVVSRGLRAVACIGALGLYAVPGRGAAERSDNACMTSYGRAREREYTGHLREARDLLLACAKRACGPYLLRECMTAYTRVESDIPTVVPRATDGAGAPQADVEVRMDGELLTSRIDGEALSVDPGLHQFTFSGAHGLASQEIVIVLGELNRHLSVVLRPPPAAPDARSSGAAPPARP